MSPTNQHEWAILDSGASSTFLLSRAPVHNAQVATNPLNIKLPDGTSIQSSHIAELALSQLPQKARFAHIVPGLASHSLVSVLTLCNAGCKVVINDITCKIHYHGTPVIKCSKCTNTGLRMLPLMEEANQAAGTRPSPIENRTEQVHHEHQSSTRAEIAQFYHQSLFSPPVVTLRKAIDNKQLDSFPGLVPALLKHLPPSTATAKGHMHKN